MSANPAADGLQRPSPLSGGGGSNRAGEDIAFAGVCDLQVELEGDARLI